MSNFLKGILAVCIIGAFCALLVHYRLNGLALLILILGIGLGYPITGILADKLGRKKMLLIYSVLTPISQVLVVIWAMHLEDQSLRIIFSSLLATLSTIALYGIWILMIITIIELVPTETSGVAAGIKAVLLALIGALISFLTGILIPIWGVGNVLVVFCCVMFVAIPLIMVLIPETKGRDLKLIK